MTKALAHPLDLLLCALRGMPEGHKQKILVAGGSAVHKNEKWVSHPLELFGHGSRTL